MFLPLSPPPTSKPASDSPDSFFNCEAISLLSPSKRALSPIQPSSIDDNISNSASLPSKILPFLYLGGSRDANNSEYLKSHNIHHVINCGHENHHFSSSLASSKTAIRKYPPSFTNGTTKHPPRQNNENDENSENSGSRRHLESSLKASNCLLENSWSDLSNSSSNLTQVLDIPAFDSPQQDLRQYFVQVIKFIEKCRLSNSSVLVHCTAGISRSATFVVAYIMWYMKLSFMAAYKYVQKLRPQISPNLNFVGQLVQFAKDLNDDCDQSQTTDKTFPSDVSKQSTITALASLMTTKDSAIQANSINQSHSSTGRKRSNSDNYVTEVSTNYLKQTKTSNSDSVVHCQT